MISVYIASHAEMIQTRNKNSRCNKPHASPTCALEYGEPTTQLHTINKHWRKSLQKAMQISATHAGRAGLLNTINNTSCHFKATLLNHLLLVVGRVKLGVAVFFPSSFTWSCFNSLTRSPNQTASFQALSSCHSPC